MIACKNCKRQTVKEFSCSNCKTTLCRQCAATQGVCKDCFIVYNDKVVVAEYFADKYASKLLPAVKVLVLLLVCLTFFPAAVQGLDLKTVSYKQDVFDFEFCFLSPYDAIKEITPDTFSLYTDNFGCKGISQSLCVERIYDKSRPVCSVENKNCNTETINHANGTKENIETCDKVEICKTENFKVKVCENVAELKEPLMLNTDMVLCLKATRSQNMGSCDINFIDDTGIDAKTSRMIDANTNKVIAESAAWWNTTWNRKYKVNVTTTLDSPYIPFKIIINSSNFTLADFQANGGDLRVVNSTENGVLPFNLSYWNASGGVIFINATIVNNLTFYIYANASGAQTTTSVALTVVNLTNANLHSYYAADEPAGTGLQDSHVVKRTINETGTVPSISGKVDNGRGNFSAARYFERPINFTMSPNSNFSMALWFNKSGPVTAGEFLSYGDNSGGNPAFAIRFQSNDILNIYMDASSDIYTPTNNVWHHIVMNNWANNTVEVWADGLRVKAFARGTNAGGLTKQSLGSSFGGSSPASHFTLDEIAFYNKTLNDVEIADLYNNGSGTTYGFFAQPNISIGAGESSIQNTFILAGFLNTSWQNITGVINGGDDFRPFAIYNYTVNNTGVYPLGNCSFNQTSASVEYYNTTNGNYTICLGGACAFTNLTNTFTLDTSLFDYDIVRLGLCHNGTNAKDAKINLNCIGNVGFNQTVPAASIPSCSGGHVHLSYNTTGCVGASATVNLSVWSTGTGVQNSVTLVIDDVTGHDGVFGIDRFRTEVGKTMTWNATNGWFNSVLEYEAYSGIVFMNVSCYDSATIQNQTALLNLSINNIPPVALIDEHWYWLLNDYIAFTDGFTDAKYPLNSTFNISTICSDVGDTNLSHKLNLSFSNGTVISTMSMSGAIMFENYTKTNFSIENDYLDGVKFYNLSLTCNDSFGDTSNVRKAFSAENARPVGNWNNASGSSFSWDPSFQFYCNDTEGQLSLYWIYVNGTVNKTGTTNNATFTNFATTYPDGTFQLDLVCADSLRNATGNQSLLFTKQTACIVGVYGLVSDGRYQDVYHSLVVNCSNGVVPDTCYYSINEFTNNTVTNCSAFNVTLEIGRNRLNFYACEGLICGSFAEFSVWAKKLGTTSFSEYMVIIVLIVGFFGLMYAAYTMKLGLLDLLAGFCLIFIGIEVWAFSIWAGSFIMAVGFLWALLRLLN